MVTQAEELSGQSAQNVTLVTPWTARTGWGLLGVAYSAASILQHDWAQQFVRSVQKDPTWTVISLAVVAIGLFGLASFGIRSLPVHSDKRLLALSWSLSGLFVYFSHTMLMSVHTEAVHFIQYGLLAVPAFMAFRSTGLALASVAIVGIADEAYQYWGLYAGWGIYFDWNDVVLNVVAGGLGLLYLVTARPRLFGDERPLPAWNRHAGLLLPVLLFMVAVVGLATGWIALHPSPDAEKTLLLLDRGGPPSRFWLRAWWSGKFYHQLSLWSALGVTTFVLLCYRICLSELIARVRR